MSLAAAPTYTPASSATNVATSQSLAANTAVSFSPIYVGYSGQTGAQGTTTTGSAIAGCLQVWNTGGGTVATTNGCLVQAFRCIDGTNYDTIAYSVNNSIATVASTTNRASWNLSPGMYKITLTNQDVTNAITIQASLGTIA